MGLFNTIVIDLTCPNCQGVVEWQSKEMEYNGYFLESAMQDITLGPGMNGEMHTHCDNCKLYSQYPIQDGKVIADV